MLDSFGRRINYVRISVTDRCDLRCNYCMPLNNKNFIKKEEILTIQNLMTISKGLINLGIKKFRITGGEPLIRKGIKDYIEFLNYQKNKEELEEILLTTNGTQLSKYAEFLFKNDVKRINVSIDSLDPNKFCLITNGGILENVINGIKKAKDLGIKIKINTVLLKNVNDDEIIKMVKWCSSNNFNLSFIEVMPIGDISKKRKDQYLSVEFAKKIIEKNFGLTESNHKTSGPSKYFECKDINLTVGFISPISNHFCSTCNRLRVTSNGKIFPCLGDNGSEDLVPFLGTDQEIQLKKILSNVIFNKPEKHYFDVNKKSYIKERFMNTTGG